MINQIALVKSFIDKDALIKKYDFSHYIISYEKEKLNNIIDCKKYIIMKKIITL